MLLKKIGLVCLLFLLVGCQTTGNMTNEQKGTGAGAVFGATVGGLLGGGEMGIIVGGVLGGLLGNAFGSYLDEEDQKKLANSTQKALDSGESQAWDNPDTGVKAEVLVKDIPEIKKAEVVPTRKAQVASANLSNSQTCREVTQNITLKDGSTKTETVKACKGPDGWEIMS